MPRTVPKIVPNNGAISRAKRTSKLVCLLFIVLTSTTFRTVPSALRTGSRIARELYEERRRSALLAGAAIRDSAKRFALWTRRRTTDDRTKHGLGNLKQPYVWLRWYRLGPGGRSA